MSSSINDRACDLSRPFRHAVSILCIFRCSSFRRNLPSSNRQAAVANVAWPQIGTSFLGVNQRKKKSEAGTKELAVRLLAQSESKDEITQMKCGCVHSRQY